MHDPIELRVATPFGELAAWQWGDAGAPPLLALHGWLDNAAGFSRLGPLLAGPCRVLAPDLPGHGHSAHLPPGARRYHVVDQVDHVLNFADAVGLERFDLLGHSLGAGIASLLAAAAPERVRRLLLIEGLGPLGDTGTGTLARWRKAHAERTRSRRALRRFGNVEQAVAARVAVGDLAADEVRPIVERNLRADDDGLVWRSDPRLRLTTPLRIDENQMHRVLAGIEAATLLLLAEPATPYLPPSVMRARAACVGDIRVESMHGPHHLHVRRPDVVARHMTEFLER